MTSHQSFKNKMGGLAAAVYVRTWMGSLSYRTAMYESAVDPVRPDFPGPAIGVFWHEYLLAPFFLRGNTNTAILTSQHRDADWLAEAARHLGFTTIRGSTFRGGSQALLELLRRDDQRNLGIACDGPRGPRRRLAQGPIYLSSKLQVPIVTFGIGYDRPFRMRSWDRFAVPRPFSRVCWISGPRIQIPPRLSRTELERYRRQVEEVLDRLTLEAEAWAMIGGRKVGQTPSFLTTDAQRHRRPMKRAA
jgi:lysophospholipid acyltransferase (LPLAT)-like uncharacterized protein